MTVPDDYGLICTNCGVEFGVGELPDKRCPICGDESNVWRVNKAGGEWLDLESAWRSEEDDADVFLTALDMAEALIAGARELYESGDQETAEADAEEATRCIGEAIASKREDAA